MDSLFLFPSLSLRNLHKRIVSILHYFRRFKGEPKQSQKKSPKRESKESDEDRKALTECAEEERRKEEKRKEERRKEENGKKRSGRMTEKRSESLPCLLN
jgi:lysyl-tRNA synthetase class I